MPLLNGFEATRQILEAAPATKVLMLSAHSDEAYVEEAVNCGAMGYLIKQTSADTVCTAIREVQKGNSCFSPSIPSRLPTGTERNEKRQLAGARRRSDLRASKLTPFRDGKGAKRYGQRSEESAFPLARGSEMKLNAAASSFTGQEPQRPERLQERLSALTANSQEIARNSTLPTHRHHRHHRHIGILD
jgi:DNA-binding response OmpR family regulator